MLGGVRGALSRQADAALAEAAVTTGRSPADVLAGLLGLVTINDDGQPTRRRADLTSLPNHIRAEMEVFVDQRILTIHRLDEDGDSGGLVIDIAHEQILTAWQPLVDAISSAADTLRLQADVTDAATTWDRDNRPTSHLWELDRSRRATQHLNLNNLSRTTQEFLTVSRRHGQRRRLRATAILTILLLLVTTGGVAALIQRNHADSERRQAIEQERRAIVRGLILKAEQLRDRNQAEQFREALRLGLAADTLESSPESLASLEVTLAVTPWFTSVNDLDGERLLQAVAFSADGRTLATLDEIEGGRSDRVGGQLRLWDISNPRPPVHLASIDDSQRFTSVVFSPDGRTLAAIKEFDERIQMWDISNLRNPVRLASIDEGGDGYVTSVAFGFNSPTLAATSVKVGRHDGGQLRLWDISNPRTPVRLANIDDDQHLASVTFSPSSPTLATTSELNDRFGGQLRLWDISNPRAPARLANIDDDHYLTSVTFSPNSPTLAAATRTASKGGDFVGGRLRMWDISNPRAPVRLASVDDDQLLTSVTFSPNGFALATTGADSELLGEPGGGRRLRLWDISNLRTPTLITSINETADQGATTVAFVSNSPTLVTTGQLIGSGWRLVLRQVPRSLGPSIDLHRQVREGACVVAGGGFSEEEWRTAVPTISYENSC